MDYSFGKEKILTLLSLAEGAGQESRSGAGARKDHEALGLKTGAGRGVQITVSSMIRRLALIPCTSHAGQSRTLV